MKPEAYRTAFFTALFLLAVLLGKQAYDYYWSVKRQAASAVFEVYPRSSVREMAVCDADFEGAGYVIGWVDPAPIEGNERSRSASTAGAAQTSPLNRCAMNAFSRSSVPALNRRN